MLNLLSVLPILCMLVCLLLFNLSVLKASVISFFITLAIFTIQFGAGLFGTAVAIAKGSSLALFVILIVWGAMLLYNLVNETKALDVINRNIEIAIENKFHQFILISWAFAPFLGGIAGFGVPVVVAISILISLGFKPVVAACAVLIGNSWGISFGSMGSSIFTIDIVTRESIYDILVYMARFGMIGMFGTGLVVCYLYGGVKHVWKGLPFLLAVTVVMSIVLNIVAKLGMLSVVGLLTGLSGLIFGLVLSNFRKKRKVQLYSAELNLFQAMTPYFLTIILSISFFILNPTLSIDLSFPGYETLFGQVVPSEENYISFNVLRYPFTVILIASSISVAIFYKKKTFNAQTAKTIIAKTAQKCIPTTVALLFLLSMTVMMIDSGMTERLAVFLATVTGDAYPLISPFIGCIGTFVTGSNTNSNIIFGSFQEIAAGTIGKNAAMMCATQSMGASIGGALSPTVVSLAATAAHIQNNEGQIYRKIILPILAIILCIGIANFLFIT